MTTVEEDRTQACIDGLLQALRDAESDFRRSYARVLDVVAELNAKRAGAVAKGEAKARAAMMSGVPVHARNTGRTVKAQVKDER